VKKSLLFIVPFVILIFSGCGTTLKQQWYNFNAYYNTFYNANQYFEAGLEQNRSQRSEINPNELIRIHPPPTSAGAQNFETSIEKSADILRRHSQSKYVDDALQLIAISYFYRQEYFAALEKFQELHVSTSDPALIHSAVLWEGRTYLELELYGEGSRFMEARIEEVDNWAPEKLSEARVILAQLYAYRGNLHQAGNQLLLALEDLEGRELRSRAYFHYGQIMEQMGNFPQANYAFSQIQNMRASFDLEYNAKLKLAEIFRKQGEYEDASLLLRSMERDDKFYDFRLELLYEIARTERLKGNPGRAESYFKRVLYSGTISPAPELVAKTYYGLAEIYRYNHNNFQLAAAYYDSAASTNVNRNRMPEGWDANELARAYGEYASVKQEITRLDSLLHLGRLPAEEFDQKIAEIRAQKQAEIEEQRSGSQSWDELDRQTGIGDDVGVTTDTGRHGFLNINNRTLLEQSGFQFRAVWGDRPLADDWRRREAVTGSRVNFEEQQVVVEAGETGLEVAEDEAAPAFQLDLSEIPFETSEQDSVEARIYKNYYQLGNIYLMNLSMPDSARTYFKRVIRNGPEAREKAPAFYALTEIYLEEENWDEALRWAVELIERYPETSVARRAASRMNLNAPVAEENLPHADEISMAAWDQIFSQPGSPDDKASRLIELAENSSDREQAATLLLEAAEVYIKAAREDSLYDDKFRQWQRLLAMSENDAGIESFLYGRSDSSGVEVADLMSTGEGVGEPLTVEKVRDIYPFNGELWDRTRELLIKIDDIYRGTNAARKASMLLENLEKYPVLKAGPEPEPDDLNGQPETETPVSLQTDVPTCSELGAEAVVRGGKEHFLGRVYYPEWTDESSVRGDLEFEVLISASGELLGYEQTGRFNRTGIPQAVEQAMEEFLEFEPLDIEPDVEKVRCSISFLIDI
jgi:tetratricopeptide (TPR) repeat protein